MRCSGQLISSQHFIFGFTREVKVYPLPCLVNMTAPISVSLAFGPHSCASTANATVGGWPSGSTVCFSPMHFPKVLNAKQGNKTVLHTQFRA